MTGDRPAPIHGAPRDRATLTCIERTDVTIALRGSIGRDHLIEPRALRPARSSRPTCSPLERNGPSSLPIAPLPRVRLDPDFKNYLRRTRRPAAHSWIVARGQRRLQQQHLQPFGALGHALGGRPSARFVSLAPRRSHDLAEGCDRKSLQADHAAHGEFGLHPDNRFSFIDLGGLHVANDDAPDV